MSKNLFIKSAGLLRLEAMAAGQAAPRTLLEKQAAGVAASAGRAVLPAAWNALKTWGTRIIPTAGRAAATGAAPSIPKLSLMQARSFFGQAAMGGRYSPVSLMKWLGNRGMHMATRFEHGQPVMNAASLAGRMGSRLWNAGDRLQRIADRGTRAYKLGLARRFGGRIVRDPNALGGVRAKGLGLSGNLFRGAHTAAGLGYMGYALDDANDSPVALPGQMLWKGITYGNPFGLALQGAAKVKDYGEGWLKDKGEEFGAGVARATFDRTIDELKGQGRQGALLAALSPEAYYEQVRSVGHGQIDQLRRQVRHALDRGDISMLGDVQNFARPVDGLATYSKPRYY